MIYNWLNDFTSMRTLKLPNGIFSGQHLPTNLQGRNQKPDFLWPIKHDIIGEPWSVNTGKERIWSDCVGEGKPVEAPTRNGHDHALSQVVMSAVSCIYFQICLGRAEPRVLAFTMNKNLMRFFIVVGEPKKNEEGRDIWGIKYYHVKDRDLDLRVLGDSVRSLTLAKVLRRRDQSKIEEFTALRLAKGEDFVKWWIDKGTKRSEPSSDDPAKHDEKDEGGDKKDPRSDGGNGGSYGGGGGDDTGSSGGKKRRGGSRFDRGGSGGSGGGLSKMKGGVGKGKTRSLSQVITMLAGLVVSVMTL